MHLPDSAILDNLQIPGLTVPATAFEKKYIGCRKKEKRIYTDEEVAALPDCIPTHPHKAEWQTRKKTFEKLYRYLFNKKKPLSILEIGCGNGWLSHRLSAIPRSRVTGLDINFTEIQQAARVFNDHNKLKFIYGDIRSGILYGRKFDIILFAASIQYFSATDEILDLCLQHLTDSGEIHITDSLFYSQQNIPAAKKRSYDYFSGIGCPGMADHYFHHPLSCIDQYNHTVLYNPQSLVNRLTRSKIPFHWIRIKKDAS